MSICLILQREKFQISIVLIFVSWFSVDLSVINSYNAWSIYIVYYIFMHLLVNACIHKSLSPLLWAYLTAGHNYNSWTWGVTVHFTVILFPLRALMQNINSNITYSTGFQVPQSCHSGHTPGCWGHIQVPKSTGLKPPSACRTHGPDARDKGQTARGGLTGSLFSMGQTQYWKWNEWILWE